MWMTRLDTELSDGGTQFRREYECSQCGAKRVLETRSNRITPLASVAVHRRLVAPAVQEVEQTKLKPPGEGGFN